MSRIQDRFDYLRNRSEKGLVTFITAGDPDLATTEELIGVLERAGADIIELGVPFSDPMADGPTIQLASERALSAGTTLPAILDTVSRARRTSQVPILLMGYYNPVLSYGLERFAVDAAAAGVDGLLIVDLPPEESDELRNFLKRSGIDLICLLTPTSDAQRIDLVRKQGSGFLYYVSVTGVTGARREVSQSVAGAVARIRERTDLPVAVGFGISTPEQAAQMAAAADAVVVGSALVSLFEQNQGAELVNKVAALVSSLKDAVRRPVGSGYGD
jgi:tryptophan synthase alpha chain